MAEALVYTDEWTSTELAGYDGDRIPDTWNYPVFTLADGTAAAFMGDPHRRLPEVAAALTDVPVDYTDSRDEAMRILGDLCAAGTRLRHARSPLRAVRVPRGRGADGRRVGRNAVGTRAGRLHRGRAGGARAGAPFRSSRSPIGVRGPAPRFAEHTRAVLAERLHLSDDALDALEADGVIERPTSG